jgi:hypothetical protein
MRQINEQAYVKNGVAIEPGETVLFISTSFSRTRCRLGTYIGIDSFGNPLVRFPSRRFYWKSKVDNGWVPIIATTSLPRRRLYSVKHFETYNPHSWNDL